ncbi:MAG: uroporphyrinogen-III synthase [Hyphomicrobiales bacterium]|nr:uroporphyrinogen-III synthase [Hyphomicrobiales bacterium]
MRVLVTRAEDFAAATAERLAAAGHEALLAPATEIARLDAPVPPGPFDALAATSARAPMSLASGALPAFADTPFYAVGEATAAAARRSGFGSVRAGEGDGAALARRIVGDLGPGARVLLLAGEDRKPDFEAALAAAGVECEVLEVYAARERSGWNAGEAASVVRAEAALHHSQRSAALALRLAQGAGVSAAFRRLLHVCISIPASAPLREAGCARISVARRPTDAEMVRALSPTA